MFQAIYIIKTYQIIRFKMCSLLYVYDTLIKLKKKTSSKEGRSKRLSCLSIVQAAGPCC